MRKLFTLTIFFIITPCVLGFSVIYFSFLTFQKNQNNINLLSTPNVSYAALPTNGNLIQAYASETDGRIEKLQQFFQRYGSPLEPYASDIVKAADENGFDYTLLPAIAAQESLLCLKAIPGTDNCWGWGIYGKKVTVFPDYKTAIETVSKGLANNYIKKGLKTPSEIMSMYNPSNNGSWADGVDFFLNQLQ